MMMISVLIGLPAGVLAGHAMPVFYAYAPLCAVLTSLVSTWFWHRAIAGYTSAGG